MSEGTFDRRYGNVTRHWQAGELKKALDGRGLCRVASRRGRCVRIDVVNVFSRQACVPKRQPHGAQAAAAFFVTGRNVRGVARCSVSPDLAYDFGTSINGMLGVFQHQRRSPLAHHKSIAGCIEWPAGIRGSSCGQSAHSGKSSDSYRRERRLTRACTRGREGSQKKCRAGYITKVVLGIKTTPAETRAV
jgi:hypothetical protein